MKEFDFLPANFHRARRHRRQMRRHVIAGVIIATGLLALNWASPIRLSRASDPAPQDPHEAVTGAIPARGYVGYTPLVSADRRIEMIDRLQNEAPPSLTIAEVARCLDDTTTTQSLTIEWRDELQVTIIGTASSHKDVNALHDRLNRCDFFDLVKLQILQPISQPDRLEYTFKLTVVVGCERARAGLIMTRPGAGS